MEIHLMRNPWAARVEHVVRAKNADDWRHMIVSLPPLRFHPYAAAVVIPDVDSVRPFPVQSFNGAAHPRNVMSRDGFLQIVTGLTAAPLAADQWAVLTAFPDHLRSYNAWLGRASAFTRRAFCPMAAASQGEPEPIVIRIEDALS